jgi:hypothetical protein
MEILFTFFFGAGEKDVKAIGKAGNCYAKLLLHAMQS